RVQKKGYSLDDLKKERKNLMTKVAVVQRQSYIPRTIPLSRSRTVVEIFESMPTSMYSPRRSASLDEAKATCDAVLYFPQHATDAGMVSALERAFRGEIVGEWHSPGG